MKRSVAALALLFLLLRPVCDAWAAAGVHPGSMDAQENVLCCADLEDGSVVHLSAPAANPSGTTPDNFPPAARMWTLADNGAALAVGPRHPPDAYSNRLSFYARSARIRR